MANIEQSPLELEIEAAKQKLAELKAAKKAAEQKEKPAKKGVPAMWKNKAGREIKGLATLYYCITLDGVTHLKAVDSPDVVLLEKL